MPEQVDVVVVGMGPGGEEVAGRLAEAGLDVVGVDGRLVGGECPYWGCVPSKMMIRAADLLAEGRRIPAMAGTSTVGADWAPVARRIRDATDGWNDKAAVDRFEGKGGHFVRGWGRLDGPGRVTVDGPGRVTVDGPDGIAGFEARRAVVLNPGTVPSLPPIPGLADTPYWTNQGAIEVETLPASLIVIGGGAIGVELSQVFARFGVEVTVVEVAPRLLPPEEPEAGELLEAVLGAEGLRIVTGARITAVTHRPSGPDAGFRVELDGTDPLAADTLLVATGRRTDLARLGLGSVGLDEQARFIPVDDHCRAGERLWAVGDATGKGAFTHVSMYQAGIVVDDVLGRHGPAADYRALPRVTFTDPEIGSVGLSEQAAVARGLRVRTGSASIPDSARGWIHGPGNDGFVKLVEDRDRGVLVGATTAGPNGGEVLSMLTLAVHAEVPVLQLRTMIYAYPTFHRAVEAALAALVAEDNR